MKTDINNINILNSLAISNDKHYTEFGWEKPSNCRTCSNLMIITEHGEMKRKCTERLETRYDD